MSDWLAEIFTQTGQKKAQTAALGDRCRAKPFGITQANVVEMIEERSHLLSAVLPAFEQFCQTRLKIPSRTMLPVLWDLWLPLGMKIAAEHQQLKRPLIQGILGSQGTGKTTMSLVLELILQQLGYRTLSLSLDDLYKTYSDRLNLLQQDPRLIWRGPPGTHDVDLGLNVLTQLRQSKSPVLVPRFDKSAHGGAGDRTTPDIITAVDIIIFEGWFVGVRPIQPDIFDDAPPPILTEADRTFARDMNRQLNTYLPLWELLDSLIVLYPIDYRCSLIWRKQAEHNMIAAGKTGMTDAQIEEFVNYFWRSLHPELFIQPLVKSAALVDLVIEINPDHSFGTIYHPLDQ